MVGIVPASFILRAAARTCDVYIPIGQWTNDLLLQRGAGLGIHGIARLKPGVTLAQARADMARVTNTLSEMYPDSSSSPASTSPTSSSRARPDGPASAPSAWRWVRAGAVWSGSS